MHGRIRFGLARTLAVVLCCGTCALVQAQGVTPYDTGYSDAAYGNSAMPDNQMPVSNASIAETNADQPDLAKKVADLEKALKKIEDKAKADKEAALKKPTCNVGGMIQLDTAMFSNKNDATTTLPSATAGGTDPFVDGTAFRRLRLQATGEFWYNIDYKVELEFATTTRPGFKDVYFTIKELPWVQNTRIGHYKEPFGLEQLTSDRFTTFMERSMCDDGFIVPSRNTGVMLFGTSENERATYAVGCFLNQNGLEDPPFFGYNVVPGNTVPQLPTGATTIDDQPQAALTMRGTWTPWYDEATALEPNGSRGVWHVGSGYSYRSDLGYRSAGGATGVIARNYQVRPEAQLAPVILSTSALPAIDNQLANFETALVYGPFSAQSEVFANCIQQPGGTSVTFTGVYGYMSYFLTGENRNYNRKGGYFDRVKPYTNFFRVRTCDGDVSSGWGAWEIAYRFSHVNMLDGLPNATTAATVGLGRATDNTMGVNWYLNPYTKIAANYIFTTFDRYDTTAALTPNHTVNTFEMRAQFDF